MATAVVGDARGFHGVDDVRGAVGEHGGADVLRLTPEGDDDAGGVLRDDLGDVLGVGDVPADDGEVGIGDGRALVRAAGARGLAHLGGIAREDGDLRAAAQRLDHALGAGAAGAAKDDDVTLLRGGRLGDDDG